MKRLSFFILLLFSVTLVTAQPVNDDCDGIIDLGIPPTCPDDMIYSNVDATASDIGFGNIPDCFNGGTVQNDVWFMFTTSDTIFDYTIYLEGADDNGNSIMNPQIALYRGDCTFDGLSEIACISSDQGETYLELDVLGLTPNIQYFIRINDYSATATPNWGDFRLCIDELEPINTIDDGGSTLCSGELYDSGGPEGDYTNNEDYTFTICPDQPSACITFTLDYYNIEVSDFGITDQLIFYDSDEADPNALIANLAGSGFQDLGGGGVCYMVQATSGCLTVQFISDGANSFDGWAGSWECSNQPCDPVTPITVENNITEEQILDFITTPQTTVEITDINCADEAYGIFEAGDNSDLGLDRGLLLTSGDLDWAIGPNNDGGGGNFNSNNGFPGDDDLDYLSITFGDGDLSNDACILEMDVFVATDELVFEYVFGSEEYPEFVNQFNDIFAFLISGPGIVGDPNMNNQENIAVLPDGSNTFVEINSVNNLLNWEYYRDNTLGQSIQYDGLTSDYLGVKKSLTARADVIPCNTYHLKLAIADRGDFAWDSGVFISELKGGSPDMTINFNSGIDYLIEDCTDLPDDLVISLSSPQDDTVSYNVVIGGVGTAELGVDYLLDMPDVIVFPPGVTELSFPITVLSDLEEEPIETIQIALTSDFGCGLIELTSVAVELHDALSVNIVPDSDTTYVCAGTSASLGVMGASTYFWTPVSIMSDAQSPNPSATPTESQWVSVVGNVGICSAEDSIYLEIIDPVIAINALDPVAICQGDSVTLQVIDNVDHTGLFWEPTNDISNPNGASVEVSPDVPTDYIATVNLFGCAVSDTVSIDVSPFTFPEMAEDTTICENYSVQLAFLEQLGTTTYEWSPAETVDDPISATPIATPDATTTYQIIATSANEACSDTAEVTVTVLPADIDITNPDTTFICLGETIDLTAITSLGTAENVQWTSSDDSVTENDVLSVTITPEETTQYFTTYEVGNCIVYDSIVVRVDSLPESLITAIEDKDPYCVGETVTLISPTYEPSDYPDMELLWLPGLGYETPDSLWNMVLITQDTFEYQRIINNNACVDTASITLNVVQPPTVTIDDQIICPGDEVTVEANSDAPDGVEEEFEWSYNGMTSTDEILQTGPIFESTTVNLSYNYGDGCGPVNAAANVTVIGSDVTVLVDTEPDTVFAGGSVLLNATIESDPPLEGTLTYDWYIAGELVGTSTVPTFTATNIQGGSDEFNSVLAEVVITTEEGCMAEGETTFIVRVSAVMIPNVFTPNGDEYNDEFKVYHTDGVDILSLRVYNRWGQLVFETNGDEAWDGNFKGEPAQSDVYIYTAVYNLNGEEVEESGEITLLR